MSDLALIVYGEWKDKIDKGLTLIEKFQLDKCLRDHGLSFEEILEKH
jgi:hypothetical protein